MQAHLTTSDSRGGLGTMRLALCALLLAVPGLAGGDGGTTVVVKLTATVAAVMCNDPARSNLPACAKPQVSLSVQPFRYATADGTQRQSAQFEVRVDRDREVVVRTLLY